MILPVLLLLGVIGAARAQQPDTQSATASVEELSAEIAALKAKTSTWDKVLAALPAETDIPVANLESVEHKFQDFGYSHGTGIFKFIYPGCPAGGDMFLGHTTNENIVQYKGRPPTTPKLCWTRSIL